MQDPTTVDFQEILDLMEKRARGSHPIFEPPTKQGRLLDRDLSTNELVGWFEADTPQTKIEYAVATGIARMAENGRFLIRNHLRTEGYQHAQKWEELKRLVLRRDSFQCSYCGSSERLVVDHVVPFSAWPEQMIWLANSASNLTASCWDCNSSKSNRSWDTGWKQLFPVLSCSRMSTVRSINTKARFGSPICRFKNCKCAKVKAWCWVCEDTCMAPICRFPKQECEG